MKTPKARKSSNTKKLKFDPEKNDKQRLWNIEEIVNDRVSLKISKQPKIQANVIGGNQVIDYVSRKQYEIAWQQNCSKGYWPNTWQPQENIPDYTRLDYLLRKKSLLRISKKKGRLQRMKNKESFKQHLQFTMKNITSRSEIFTPLTLRKQNVKKIIEKKENQKLTKKEEDTQKYKDWYISYNFNSQAFEKVIERLMKGQKNTQNLEIKKQENFKTAKLPFTKQEISESFSIEKNQTLKLKTEQQNPVSRSLNQQNNHHRSTHHILPLRSTNKFIKDIEYIANQNYVDYFRLKLFDNSISYVSQEDLVKYFPFAYKKFLVKVNLQSIDEGMTQFQGLKEKENFTHKKCVENLSEKIGIRKSDFDFSNGENNLSYPKRTISNFKDMSDIFGDRQQSIENEQETPEQIEFQRPNISQITCQTKKRDIYNYFSVIQRSFTQTFILQQQKMNNQQENYFNKKSGQNNLFESTRCKELFKNHLLRQNKKVLSQKVPQISNLVQIQKISKNEKRIQKSPQKKVKTQSIPTNNLKTSTQSRKIAIKKAQQQSKTKETTEIGNQEKSLQNSKLERSGILSDDKQIYEILKVMEKPLNHEDNFYDSDDERN